MRNVFGRTAVIAATIAALGVGGTAVALAESSQPDSSQPDLAAATQATPAKHAHAKGLLARVEHGEVVGKKRTFDVQRGTVTAASPTSLTVRSADGFTQTYTVTATSKIRRLKASAQASAVVVNDRVRVLADRTPQGLTVTRLGDSGPAPAPN